MTDAAEKLFNSLNSYTDLKRLIQNGDSENLYLECKAPETPSLSKSLKAKLAEALSGFSNTEGGIIIWGISTTRKLHSKLDILTQIEPIGNCRYFAKEIETAIPSLTSHPITNCRNKVITKNEGDSKGVILTFVPKTTSDPLLSNNDNVFYFRSGDEFRPLPHGFIKKLFAATSVPDLRIVFDSELVKLEDNFWTIPIILTNKSYAVARDITVNVTVLNPSNCESISCTSFIDTSHVNPGKKMFNTDLKCVIHKGLNQVIGRMKVKMKKKLRSKRLLKISYGLYSDKMIGKKYEYSIQLAKSGFKVKLLSEKEI